MASCDTLYSSEYYNSLKIQLRRALNNNNLQEFIEEKLIQYNPGKKQVRLTPNEADSEDKMIKALTDLDNDISKILREWDSQHPDKRVYDTAMATIRSALNISIDTQSAAPEGDNESKTLNEVADKNITNLDKHLTEFYGQEAYDIRQSVKQNFKDMLIGCAYYDVNSGLVREQTNESLNRNIKEQKERLFSTIVRYLKSNNENDNRIQQFSDKMYNEDGSLNAKNYFNVLTTFYNEVSKDSEFNSRLQQAHISRVLNEEEQDKTDIYKELIAVLKKGEESKKTGIRARIMARMKRKFTGYKQKLMEEQLYDADHYSEYYAAIRDAINGELKSIQGHLAEGADLSTIEAETLMDLQEPLEIIEKIEKSNDTILDAANAYTMLRYFDRLLKDSIGDQISTAPHTFGIEVDTGDKYLYHEDTTHEIKGWQTSEDIGSEKHTSQFTKAVLGAIRIFNYRTGEFMHKRVDSTTFIVALRNFVDAIATGKMTFDFGNSKNKENYFRELKWAVVNMHANPVANLQIMLERLFEKPPQAQTPLIETPQGNIIDDFSISVLKSVYDVVFNKNNSNSFFKQSMRNTKSNSIGVQNLLEEIAGYADRNMVASYLETVFDYETGQITVRAKKKFFNNKNLYQLQTGINLHVNRKISPGRRRDIQRKYDLRSTVGEGASGNTSYNVKIGGKTFTLVVPNQLRTQLLGREGKQAKRAFDKETNEIFKALESINLVEFADKYTSGATLSADEKLLKNILQFIDDTLDMKILENPNLGLQTLQSYRLIYTPIDGLKSYLQPLVKLAIRAAYVNSIYVEAQKQNQTLAQYLESSQDSVYDFYKYNRNVRTFTDKFHDLRYIVASYNDRVLDMWTDAGSILQGEASKATTKDKQGNSIPNNTVSKLGGNLRYYLAKQFNTNVGSLAFVKDPNLVIGTYHDLEVTTMGDETKSIREFSPGELYHHALFNKFWGSYLQTGNVIIQPTVYSDKTTFLNWEIKPKINDINIVESDEEHILDLYKSTIGAAYKKVYDVTTDKLRKIVEEWAKNKGVHMTADFRDILHLMTEQDLVRTANQMGLTVELNKDYRIIKDKSGKSVVGINELLEYNATLFNNKNALREKLYDEKLIFLQQLLDANSSFQVLTGNDTIGMFTGEIKNAKAYSSNPVLKIILDRYSKTEDRKKYMREWVDEDTGKLILAKQVSANGKKVNNIISISDSYSREGVILNPLLDTFFNVEGFLSNNLRFSLTGFEINHATGKSSPFARMMKVEDLDHWNAMGYGEITKEDWNVLHNGEGTGVLDRVLDLDDLNRELKRQIGSENLTKVLIHIRDLSYNYATNTAQSTQFKRNVIIPATLQYCLQNSKEGIPPKVKCAVIRDLGAPVWNFRGDHEGEIDSSDGNARITAFQCIMENRSLGSQAVGFVKKPIWHAYDTNSGTAFLAKFATSTITNEEMRASINSTTNLHNLFKKMTNLQWNPDDGIDLTKSLVERQAFGESDAASTWFNTVILGGHNLYYENKYGERIEITGFKKTVTKDGNVLYYTEERKVGNQISQRKYHLFYNTEGETSVHITTDSYQHADNLMKSTPGVYHTINSLYELHAALGGIYCVDSMGNPSEFNNEVVVNFMNNVGSVKEGVRANDAYIDQTTYDQPLKKYHIGYALNNTAVKNGAKNINPSTSWSDDTELTYFEVDSDGLGMQMNADHDIIDSELTEFSQVIAATAAYGYTYDQCNEIFQGLAKTALQSSKGVLEAVDKFLQNNLPDSSPEARNAAHSELYDAIGRIILVNQSIKESENLTNIIMQSVQKIFDKYSDHTNDVAKIPFSDPNIYRDFISTLASTITKRSIKRTHPGSGSVLVPGYNVIQYFEVKDNEGVVRKMMAKDVLKKARAEYRQELISYLKGKNDGKEVLKVGKKTFRLRVTPTEELEHMALSYNRDEGTIFSEYYTPLQSSEDTNKHLIKIYLARRQVMMPIYTDRSYFMPSDIVEVLDENDNVVETIDLNSLDVYYKFKDGLRSDGTSYPLGYKYRESATSPHNLRPSLIRWQYEIGKDEAGQPITRYMNYFDLAHVRDAYVNNRDTKDPIYRKQVQDSLHNIKRGVFYDAAGQKHRILEGTLENTEAELVMSNMYKDTFGIDNESLNDILEQGEDYFRGKTKNMVGPQGSIHDFAFLRANGHHTLVTIGNVSNTEDVREIGFGDNTKTNNEGEVYLMSKGRQMFKIARWVDVDDVTYDVETQRFIKENDTVNQEDYRVKDGRVQKRYDFVKKYQVTKKVNVRGRKSYNTYTLYQVANVSVFNTAFGIDPNDTQNQDGIRQQAKIIKDIYLSGDYKMIEINEAKVRDGSTSKKNALAWALTSRGSIAYDSRINSDVVELMEKQLVNLKCKSSGSVVVNDVIYNKEAKRFENKNGEVIDNKDEIYTYSTTDNTVRKKIEPEDTKDWVKDKEEFLQREAHKKWVSFQDSTKFISSRIPAQTLQSFMAMKLIAWTENSKNMAYVSHFQTYLQGSDYDIDKAYIMGQNYDANSTYVAWSPYFDYTSLQTLEASKGLPVPKDITVNQVDDGVDISSEVAIMRENSFYNNKTKRLDTTGKSEESKVKFINALADALRKVDANDGNYSIGITLNKAQKEAILQTLIHHEKYLPPESVAEAAYKNVASANIYAVSHDVRNRDQAYTAIAMEQPRGAAAISPKGEQATHLNMLNPFTKYMMQYQCLVGKNVIGITANGEKFWFNFYYYCTKVLKSGNSEDIDLIRFKTSLSRVQGRAKGNPVKKTVTHIPDLNARDQQIKRMLMEHFNVTEEEAETEEYKYVDQAISQLLSAATDNAKELILAKLNADTNYSKMFLYLICTGYSLDDIAAFMTCPVSDFIISRTQANVFQTNNVKANPQNAINAASGYINAKLFLHGYLKAAISEGENDPGVTDTSEEVTPRSKLDVVKNKLMHELGGSDYKEAALRLLGLDQDTELKSLDASTLMKGLILSALEADDEDFNIRDLLRGYRDSEIQNYARYCQDVYNQLKAVKRKYSGRNGMNDMLADIKEFQKIYNLASEISNIATAYLGLNQGLPTDKVGMLKQINKMRMVVTDRESALGIYEDNLFKEGNEEKNQRNMADLIQRIREDSDFLDEQTIRDAIEAAHEVGMIRNFDPIKALTDNNYKKIAKNYVHVIKGTANVIDMMDKIPHYEQTLNCFKALIISDRTLAAKSRLIGKLVNKGEAVTDQSLNGIIRYVDQLFVADFLDSEYCVPVELDSDISAIGFNAYFDEIPVNSYNLSTPEGVAGFKHFIETEFIEYLKANHPNNTLTRHLILTTSGDQTVLATDVDLINPNTTTASRLAYDEILRGIDEFEKIPYNGSYTISDLFQLYNLIVNNNQYGGERLTTIFKDRSNPNSVINRYYNFVQDRDYAFDEEINYNETDYQINAAPLIPSSTERFHTEKYIKVKDPVWGYVLKEYKKKDNSYEECDLLPALKDNSVDAETRDLRRANFSQNYPFEMPERTKSKSIIRTINYEGEVTEEMRKDLLNVLTDLVVSGKALIFKDC